MVGDFLDNESLNKFMYIINNHAVNVVKSVYSPLQVRISGDQSVLWRLLVLLSHFFRCQNSLKSY